MSVKRELEGLMTGWVQTEAKTNACGTKLI